MVWQGKAPTLALGLAIIALLAGIAALNFEGMEGKATAPGSALAKVGVIAPLTGDVAVYGDYVEEGAGLALQEIGSKGGLGGRQIKLVWEDDQCDSAKSVTAVQKLISVDKVDAILSFSCSSPTLAHVPIAEQGRVPTVISLASAEALKGSGDYIFRNVPSDAAQASDLARLAKGLGYRSAAVLFVNNAWGAGLKEGFAKDFGNVVAVEAMEESASNVSTQLEKIAGANPEALFMPCYIADCVQAVKQMKELGMDLPVLSADTFYNQQVLDALGSSADGTLVSHPSEGRGMEWEEFRERFGARYGKEPNVNHANAYDGMYVLYYALLEAGTDPEKLRDALYQTDFTGPSGRNSFNALGEVSKPFAIEVVKGGKFVPYAG